MELSLDVLDGTDGRYAEGLPVTLQQGVDGQWRVVATGQVSHGELALATDGGSPGCYRLRLNLDRYFLPLGTEPALAQIDLTFRVFQADERVRLMLTVAPAAVSIAGAAPRTTRAGAP